MELPSGWREDLDYEMTRHYGEKWVVYVKDIGNGFMLRFFNPAQPAGWGFSRAEVSLYRGPGWYGLPDALYRSFAHTQPKVADAKSLEEMLALAEEWATYRLLSRLSDEKRFLETNLEGVRYRKQRVKELQAVLEGLREKDEDE